MTAEQKIRLSLAHKGHKVSAVTRKLLSNYMKMHPERWYGGKCGQCGSKSFCWKGGLSNNGNGYIRIYKPDHPGSNKRGYIYEHRLIAEKIIGRHLKFNEVVHHIDGNPSNNNIQNLKIMIYGQHIRHHEQINRMRDL